jgi:hypothetical protein
MGSMKRYVWVFSLAAGLVCWTACKSAEQKAPAVGAPAGGPATTTIVEAENPRPMWVTAEGRWEEQWKKEHPDQAKQYLWVVGTSQPVESIKFEQVAEKSASDQAIFELCRALGITVESMGMNTEGWDNATRDLVIGSYKEALETQMVNQHLNFKVYEWYGYVVQEPAGPGGYTPTSYIKKGLYRLDTGTLSETLADETAKSFAKNLQERVNINTEEQRKLVDRAKELNQKQMDKLLGK